MMRISSSFIELKDHLLNHDKFAVFKGIDFIMFLCAEKDEQNIGNDAELCIAISALSDNSVDMGHTTYKNIEDMFNEDKTIFFGIVDESADEMGKHVENVLKVGVKKLLQLGEE